MKRARDYNKGLHSGPKYIWAADRLLSGLEADATHNLFSNCTFNYQNHHFCRLPIISI